MKILIEKENQSNDAPEIKSDFIDEQLKSYSKLLKSLMGGFDRATFRRIENSTCQLHLHIL